MDKNIGMTCNLHGADQIIVDEYGVKFASEGNTVTVRIFRPTPTADSEAYRLWLLKLVTAAFEYLETWWVKEANLGESAEDSDE